MKIMNSEIEKPIIVNLPYGKHEQDDFKKNLNSQIEKQLGVGNETSVVEQHLLSELHYMLEYPTVYVVYSDKENEHSKKDEYVVYVGETNRIIQRTEQHLHADARVRNDWKDVASAISDDENAFSQYVIAHPQFNKSLTLDVENRLMHYLSSAESVKKLNNRRTNAQGDYYTAEYFDRIFSDIWLELHHDDPQLFPAEEIIRDSALFKASPFHQLGEDQIKAENLILEQISPLVSVHTEVTDHTTAKPRIPKLIFVQGVAGTGKTVLLSHLFYRISEVTHSDDEDDEALFKVVKNRLSSYILVNHKEQVAVYNQIATKLGLQKKSDEVVMTPTAFINRFSTKNGHGRGNPDYPEGEADIVLIDEAHLLMTQGNQGYSGKNQLRDILRRAKVVIAVFDPHQILQTRQQWHPQVLQRMFPNDILRNRSQVGTGQLDEFRHVTIGEEEGLKPVDVNVAHIRLEHQFRIDASEEVIQWIDDFANGNEIRKLPMDDKKLDDGQEARRPYEIKVFDSPISLFRAIEKKAELQSDGWNGQGLSRLLATYDWKYSSAKQNPADPNGYWNVELYRGNDGLWRIGPGAKSRVREQDSSEDTDDKTDCLSDTFSMPWNYQLKDPNPRKGFNHEKAWAEKPYTIHEVGSTFTIQGFDLNYAGVIIGPSVKYDGSKGNVVFDPSNSQNYLATNKRDGFGDEKSVNEMIRRNLRNELNVLLKRGVHGLYLFAVDEELQKKLQKSVSWSTRR